MMIECTSASGVSQAFDDENGPEDYLVVALVEDSVDIEFHSYDSDNSGDNEHTPYINLGYDQILNLIKFLSKAVQRIDPPNQSVHQGEDILNKLQNMFN